MNIIYSKLNGVVTQLNRFHVLNVTLSLLDLLIISINIAFLIYDIIVHSLPLENYVLVAGALIYVSTAGFICILIIFYSSFINDLNSKIILNLNNFALKNNKKKTFKLCQLGILQVENTENKISSGLFEFNIKFIFAMMTSFFNYLWMLLQVDLMVNNEN